LIQLPIIFESYRPEELFQIMVERIRGLNDYISQESFLFVANTVGKDHCNAREALSALSFVIAEAVHHRTERIDAPTAQMFLSQRSAPADDRDIMKTLSLIDQLALVAIFKPWKKLVSCLQNSVIAENRSTVLHI
jgi:Cdc6-like AAA superfamily ATPase